MSTQLPTDPHHCALWLLETLESPKRIPGAPMWRGRLPDSFDFASIELHLEGMGSSLAGTTRSDTRQIEFFPAAAHVYESLAHLLEHAPNRRAVPARFHIQDVGFSYPPPNGSTELPEPVVHYLSAVRLWAVLSELADVRSGGILFVVRHDAQLEISPEFGASDLVALEGFSQFISEFATGPGHEDQRRSIIRSVLVEQFRPKRLVRFADVLARFEDIARDARQSLSMYMAEFSVAKVKAEVERQNLDDTINLNKTLAEIQNQLLALPAAILLAGATIKPDELIRNYAVCAGVAVFAVFVLTMIANQRNSVDAIAEQIGRRKRKVQSMPGDSAQGILGLFDTLEVRVRRQKKVLSFIAVTVCVVIAATVVAVVEVSHAAPLSRAIQSAALAAVEGMRGT